MKSKGTNYNKIIKLLTALIALALVVNIAVFYFGRRNLIDCNLDITKNTSSKASDITAENTTENGFYQSQTKATQTQATETALAETTAEIQEETTKKASSQNPYDAKRIVINPKDYQWNLVVVNASRELPEGYVPELKEILGCGRYLDKRVAPYYEKMYYAAKKEGIILTPYSAYRSYDRQKINYENLTEKYMSRYGISRKEAMKKAASVILPPGTSEHNLGLAMDICNTLDSFANSKEYKWLTQNAYKYGFILRYTKEKQHITGIVPEPWHWRYVGVEYAKEIRDSGFCLEEWLDSKGIAY